MFSASRRFERDPPRVATMLMWLALAVRVLHNLPQAFRAERTLTCIFGSEFC